MKAFILMLLFIPSLITADILCPNSKTTCPEDKQCCDVDGEYSCCDPDEDQDVPDIRKKVYPGIEMKRPTMFGNVSFSANETILQSDWCGGYCSGTCCNGGCCEDYTLANCCSGDACCPMLNECCSGGCCDSLHKCCGNGCCEYGFSVCCRSWCCKDGYRCGSSTRSCISKGSTMSSEIAVLLLLAASVFVSRHF